MGRSIGRWFGGQEISVQLYINIIAAESDRVCKEETRTGRKVSKAKQGDVLLSLWLHELGRIRVIRFHLHV